ncbi:phosphopantetheine-binding protein [Saccharopolyspora hordei]|uniref:Acyl carrier protein n=1 Tax=Saccharopolyspora hordei TaxID=1838 RepID=A0A853AK80_9PSEU|nr:phosphopantetheine-binding protein [Saccharopolyspora hordei]NYI84438.1 acyl carrier protein [Saccharopolyspora hordei]
MPDQALEVRRRIRALLVELYGGDEFVSTVSDSASLRQSGVSSNALVSLLVSMEDAFGFEWDDDVEPEALRSIESLADHVLSIRG